MRRDEYGYRDIFKSINDNPKLIENTDWDLDKIAHDAKNSEDESKQTSGIILLGEIGAQVRKKEVEKLLLSLQPPASDLIEFETLVALISTGTLNCSKQAVVMLEKSSMFSSDYDSPFAYRISEIFRSIGNSGNAIYCDFLHSLALEQNHRFMRYILEGIQEVGSPISEGIILDMYSSPDFIEYDQQLILTLGYVGTSKSIPILREIIHRDYMHAGAKDTNLIACAAFSLAKLGDHESTIRITDLWNEGLRDTLMFRAFAFLKIENAVQPMIDAVTTTSRAIECIHALSKIKSATAIDGLRYFNTEGVEEHIWKLNPNWRGWDNERRKFVYAVLLIALDSVGDYVDKDSLHRAKERVKQ